MALHCKIEISSLCRNSYRYSDVAAAQSGFATSKRTAVAAAAEQHPHRRRRRRLMLLAAAQSGGPFIRDGDV